MIRRASVAIATLAAVAGCGSSASKTTSATRPATPTVAPATTGTTGTTGTTATTGATGTATTGTGTVPKAVTTTVPTTATPTSTAPAAKTVHLSAFRTPSSNIGCVLVSGIARCDIANRRWKPPPKPRGCPLDYGQGVEVDSKSPGHLVCAGDTALNPQATALPYGTDARSGSIVCRSRTSGVSCINEKTHHGFSLSAQSYRTF